MPPPSVADIPPVHISITANTPVTSHAIAHRDRDRSAHGAAVAIPAEMAAASTVISIPVLRRHPQTSRPLCDGNIQCSLRLGIGDSKARADQAYGWTTYGCEGAG